MNISSLLEKEGRTTTDILQCDEAISAFKTKNKEIVDIIVNPKTLVEIIKIFYKNDNPKIFRNISQLFTSTNTALLQLFIEDNHYIQYLISFLKKDEAPYLPRIVIICQILTSLMQKWPIETTKIFLEVDNVVPNLFRYIEFLPIYTFFSGFIVKSTEHESIVWFAFLSLMDIHGPGSNKPPHVTTEFKPLLSLSPDQRINILKLLVQYIKNFPDQTKFTEAISQSLPLLMSDSSTDIERSLVFTLGSTVEINQALVNCALILLNTYTQASILFLEALKYLSQFKVKVPPDNLKLFIASFLSKKSHINILINPILNIVKNSIENDQELAEELTAIISISCENNKACETKLMRTFKIASLFALEGVTFDPSGDSFLDLYKAKLETKFEFEKSKISDYVPKMVQSEQPVFEADKLWGNQKDMMIAIYHDISRLKHLPKIPLCKLSPSKNRSKSPQFAIDHQSNKAKSSHDDSEIKAKKTLDIDETEETPKIKICPLRNKSPKTIPNNLEFSPKLDRHNKRCLPSINLVAIIRQQENNNSSKFVISKETTGRSDSPVPAMQKHIYDNKSKNTTEDSSPTLKDAVTIKKQPREPVSTMNESNGDVNNNNSAESSPKSGVLGNSEFLPGKDSSESEKNLSVDGTVVRKELGHDVNSLQDEILVITNEPIELVKYSLEEGEVVKKEPREPFNTSSNGETHVNGLSSDQKDINGTSTEQNTTIKHRAQENDASNTSIIENNVCRNNPLDNRIIIRRELIRKESKDSSNIETKSPRGNSPLYTPKGQRSASPVVSSFNSYKIDLNLNMRAKVLNKGGNKETEIVDNDKPDISMKQTVKVPHTPPKIPVPPPRNSNFPSPVKRKRNQPILDQDTSEREKNKLELCLLDNIEILLPEYVDAQVIQDTFVETRGVNTEIQRKKLKIDYTDLMVYFGQQKETIPILTGKFNTGDQSKVQQKTLNNLNKNGKHFLPKASTNNNISVTKQGNSNIHLINDDTTKSDTQNDSFRHPPHKSQNLIPLLNDDKQKNRNEEGVSKLATQVIAPKIVKNDKDKSLRS